MTEKETKDRKELLFTQARLVEAEGKYFELLGAVIRKFHSETRHQTALRYIKEAEERSGEGQPQAMEADK